MSLQYDNEEEAIIEAYNRGEMTHAQMMKELNELRFDRKLFVAGKFIAPKEFGRRRGEIVNLWSLA